MKLRSLYLIVLLSCLGLNARSSTCDTLILTSQNQVDSFPLLGCDSVSYLEVIGTDITNLDSLIGLKHIQSDFRISGTSLTNLSGLDSLQSIGYFFLIQNCTLLENLLAIQNLDSVYYLEMRECSILDSIVINSLSYIKYLWLEYNASILYIDVGNSPNTSLNRFLGVNIGHNPLLQSIKVFTNAIHISGSTIQENPLLTTIYPYENLVQTGGLYLSNNDNLTELVCYPVLRLQTGQFVIHSNDALTRISIPKAKQLTGCSINNNPSLNDCCFLLSDIIFLGSGLSLYGNGSDCSDLGSIVSYCEATDPDGDNVPNIEDNCPFITNPSQADLDLDGIGNDCDNCPMIHNPDQLDTDQNGIGNLCESNSSGRIGLHTVTPLAGVHVDSSDIYIGHTQRGLIMRNFLGDCFRISINESGSIKVDPIACPN